MLIVDDAKNVTYQLKDLLNADIFKTSIRDIGQHKSSFGERIEEINNIFEGAFRLGSGKDIDGLKVKMS